jgi:hypothetical protein
MQIWECLEESFSFDMLIINAVRAHCWYQMVFVRASDINIDVDVFASDHLVV